MVAQTEMLFTLPELVLNMLPGIPGAGFSGKRGLSPRYQVLTELGATLVEDRKSVV